MDEKPSRQHYLRVLNTCIQATKTNKIKLSIDYKDFSISTLDILPLPDMLSSFKMEQRMMSKALE